eukprot:CAMPEP_0117017606 /NCGR_PEP_ID=MMETSP0472-20121206/13721_1 /TAXON_ID=693140 ORGANISM="Tiarina fusus, Strain LIS" /NCGR_SAMPLE_ID=MMETSP0472 /ASSEMBLY_ACC=CAM_ASM_000603 /LENGTH=180 /DNA_ID=CAMNT_0004722013 /DNA_START=3074 /DNA_END=3616 /DNA_ORIENTATION=-
MCDICPSRFMETPGNCAYCSLNFRGENCSDCADGWMGDNCSEKVHTSSVGPAFVVDPFVYEIVVVGLGIFLGIVCVLLVLVVIFMRIQKKKYWERDRPLLDLDEEDAVELETNPMVDFSQEDSPEPVNEFDPLWMDQTDNLNVGGDDAGLDLDDEYEGALDLDDLDSFTPQFDPDFDPRA